MTKSGAPHFTRFGSFVAVTPEAWSSISFLRVGRWVCSVELPACTSLLSVVMYSGKPDIAGRESVLLAVVIDQVRPSGPVCISCCGARSRLIQTQQVGSPQRSVAAPDMSYWIACRSDEPCYGDSPFAYTTAASTKARTSSYELPDGRSRILILSAARSKSLCSTTTEKC